MKTIIILWLLTTEGFPVKLGVYAERATCLEERALVLKDMFGRKSAFRCIESLPEVLND
jgi:hypothetical protein